MKSVIRTILIVVVLLVLAVLSPWKGLNIDFRSLLGARNTSESSSLEVSSLGGDLKVYIDGSEVGSTDLQEKKLEISPISSGKHTLKLEREADVSYPTFEKELLFMPGVTTSISYELALSSSLNNGWMISPVEKSVIDESTVIVTLNTLPSDVELLLNGKVEKSRVLKLDPKVKYQLEVSRNGYLPLNFQIFGFEEKDVESVKKYDYVVDLKLGEIPLKI